MSTKFHSVAEKSGSFSLKLWFLVLILAVSVFAANFFALNYYSVRENQALALSSELQVLSQKLANYSKESAAGNAESFSEFKATRDRIAEIVATLNKNHNTVGVRSALAQVSKTWSTIDGNADQILSSEKALVSLTNTASQFNARVPQLSSHLSEAVNSMSDYNAPAQQINLASRQIVLVERMTLRVAELVAGGEKAVSAADALSHDIEVFSEVLTGLKSGNSDRNMAPVASPIAMDSLVAAEQLFTQAEKEIKVLLDASSRLFDIRQAESAILVDSAILLKDSENLYKAYDNINLHRGFPNTYITLVSAGAALLSIVFLLLSIFRNQAMQLSNSKKTNQQQAIAAQLAQAAEQQVIQIESIIPVSELEILVAPVEDTAAKTSQLTTPVSAEPVIEPVLLEILRSEIGFHLEILNAWLAHAAVSGHAAFEESVLRAIHTINGAFAVSEVSTPTGFLVPAEALVRRGIAHHSVADSETLAGLAQVADAVQAILDDLSADTTPSTYPQLEAWIAILRDRLPDIPVSTPTLAIQAEIEVRGLEPRQLEAERIESVRIEAEWLEAQRLETERLSAATDTSKIDIRAPAELELPTQELKAPPVAGSISSEGVVTPVLDIRNLNENLIIIFAKDAKDLLEQSDNLLVTLKQAGSGMEPIFSLQRNLHMLKSSAHMAGLFRISELSQSLESFIQQIADTAIVPDAAHIALIEQSLDALRWMIHRSVSAELRTR